MLTRYNQATTIPMMVEIYLSSLLGELCQIRNPELGLKMRCKVMMNRFSRAKSNKEIHTQRPANQI